MTMTTRYLIHLRHPPCYNQAQRTIEGQLEVLQGLAFASVAASSGLWAMAVILAMEVSSGSPISSAAGGSDVGSLASTSATTIQATFGGSVAGGLVEVTASVALGTSLLAALSTTLSHQLKKYRTDRFVTGVHRWQRAGGLSLVKME